MTLGDPFGINSHLLCQLSYARYTAYETSSAGGLQRSHRSITGGSCATLRDFACDLRPAIRVDSNPFATHGGFLYTLRSHLRTPLLQIIDGPLAQRLEQRTHNPLVEGSNPSGPTKNQTRNLIRGNPTAFSAASKPCVSVVPSSA